MFNIVVCVFASRPLQNSFLKWWRAMSCIVEKWHRRLKFMRRLMFEFAQCSVESYSHWDNVMESNWLDGRWSELEIKETDRGIYRLFRPSYLTIVQHTIWVLHYKPWLWSVVCVIHLFHVVFLKMKRTIALFSEAIAIELYTIEERRLCTIMKFIRPKGY